MAAAAQDRDALLTEIPRLSETIGSMSTELARLRNLVAGLTEDPTGEYRDMGEGPAVRARQYLHGLDADRLGVDNLRENVANLEAAINELSEAQIHNVDRLEAELASLRTELGAVRSGGTSSVPERKPKALTEFKGFEKLKPYSGDPVQWKTWRWKVTTWLVTVSPSFESLINKLDRSESEPKEPEEGHSMKVGVCELTSDEEWCGEQLYQLLVQKCEDKALAIIRNQNSLGKARGLIARYRILREAEGQVETKKIEITERVFYSGRTAVAPKDVMSAIET